MYNISDDITGLKRKVVPAGIMIALDEPIGKYVALYLNVLYYLNDELLELIPVKTVVLTATQDTMLDADGVYVTLTDKDPVISEYDYFISQIDSPIVIKDLIESKIAFADSVYGGFRFN